MISKLIILGGHIQAIGLARQAYGKGIAVEAIVQDKFSLIRWSCAVKKTHFCSSHNDVLETIRRIASQDSMLFPTGDEYVELMANNRKELERLAYLALPADEIVELFANKRFSYQFAERNDIPHPRSYYPNTLDDVKRIAKEITYPCVVKPAIMYSFHAVFGKKAYLCRDFEELVSRVQIITEKQFPINKLLIQEYLSGGASALFSFGVFAVDGKSIVDIQVNRIRQNPMDFGNSTTYCVTCEHPEIEAEARRVLELTHYTGLAELEFMYDRGEYKFLEINTRAWKWHTISNQREFSFIGAWLDYLNNNRVEIGNSQQAAWEERLTDYAVILKEWLHGRMRLKHVIKTLRRKKEYAVWSWKDPVPAIMYVMTSPVLYIKRH